MSAKFPRGGEQTHSQPSIYKIRILDLMLLPKTVFHVKGYTTVQIMQVRIMAKYHIRRVSIRRVKLKSAKITC